VLTGVLTVPFTLENIIPWGRSFDEYVNMFALDEKDLSKKIIGCGDGPASFNAEATQRNCRIVSFDPIYQFSVYDIEQRVRETYPQVMDQLCKNISDYRWDDVFHSTEEVGECRLTAMNKFLADFPHGKNAGRYIPAELPALPFKDGTFDLALCSHLLFLYTKHLTIEFHQESIKELLRVAGEVRIFPLQMLSRQNSPYVEQIADFVRKDGCTVNFQEVPYEFQKGSHQMMVICKR
jgi:hypothetical protein